LGTAYDSVPPRGRCALHGLALAPDGRCARCRSDAQAAASRRILSRCALGAGTVVLLLAGYRGASAFAHFHVARDANAAERDFRPPAGSASSLEAPPALSVPPPEPSRPEARADTLPFAPPTLALSASTPDASSPDSPVRAGDDTARARDPSAVEDAMRRIDVVVYTTSWCPACKAARSWLNASRIRYTERDVEVDPGAHDALRRISGGKSIPTFDVDGQVRSGFDPSWVNAAIRRAAERKMARGGG
jgi:glutaredoxin